MGWVYYADRQPTAEDADDAGVVIVRNSDRNRHWVRSWDFGANTGDAWFSPKLLPPLQPRMIWRTAKIEDLVGKTEPIPCRFKPSPRDPDYVHGTLHAIAICGHQFWVCGHGFHWSDNCEIEVIEEEI